MPGGRGGALPESGAARSWKAGRRVPGRRVSCSWEAGELPLVEILGM